MLHLNGAGDFLSQNVMKALDQQKSASSFQRGKDACGKGEFYSGNNLNPSLSNISQDLLVLYV